MGRFGGVETYSPSCETSLAQLHTFEQTNWSYPGPKQVRVAGNQNRWVEPALGASGGNADDGTATLRVTQTKYHDPASLQQIISSRLAKSSAGDS